jgi:hypothetical protein
MNLSDSRWDSLDSGSALSQGRYLHRTIQTENRKNQCIKWNSNPKTPLFEWDNTFCALDHEATVIGDELTMFPTEMREEPVLGGRRSYILNL